MRVLFTPSGRAQFLDALRFVQRERPSAAIAFRKKAESSLQKLTRHPESGRSLPEFPELPFREVIVTPYRFFYRMHGKTVWIVAVWHGAQLPKSPTE
ncbi:MAG: type II toxin-antitoxin system RelE/ParE family toxin [Ignavibacteria bacterium]|nr:type II toxin-antitoxin system RelE/ParE family toxin [Ignavibacteria bacterium]